MAKGIKHVTTTVNSQQYLVHPLHHVHHPYTTRYQGRALTPHMLPQRFSRRGQQAAKGGRPSDPYTTSAGSTPWVLFPAHRKHHQYPCTPKPAHGKHQRTEKVLFEYRKRAFLEIWVPEMVRLTRGV